MDELRFDGRVAVVTGAGRGIGRSHALLLASKGARVVVADLGGELDGTGSSAGPATEVADEIKAHGGEAVPCVASVADEAQATSIIEMALEAFGRLDVLVNNAGIAKKEFFADLSTDDFRRMMDVHYFGTLYTCKAAWPHFAAAGYGRIVNTTSESIYGGIPTLTSYGAAKAAIYGLTRNLATDAVGTGIRVNAVAPRGNTRMAQMGKAKLIETMPGSVEQIEGVLATLRPELNSPGVAYLAHESCELNGEVLQVGAGIVSRLVMVHTRGIKGENPTAEEIAASIEKILDVEDAEVPGVVPTTLGS